MASDGRLRNWLRERARLRPNLLPQSPPWVRAHFDHAWAPMQALEQQLRPLPPALWAWLRRYPGGFVVVTVEPSHYAPGPATIRRQAVQNVAYVSVADLARQNEQPLHVIAHLLDHYLGCGGDPDGLWLSDGGGVTDRWREAGDRLGRLFPLGYGLDAVAQANIRDYFAQSLAFYCRDRRRLNVADPAITKWFRSTLWNPAFWNQSAQPPVHHRG